MEEQLIVVVVVLEIDVEEDVDDVDTDVDVEVVAMGVVVLEPVWIADTKDAGENSMPDSVSTIATCIFFIYPAFFFGSFFCC
jgi:hypothetical protein